MTILNKNCGKEKLYDKLSLLGKFRAKNFTWERAKDSFISILKVENIKIH